MLKPARRLLSVSLLASVLAGCGVAPQTGTTVENRLAAESRNGTRFALGAVLTGHKVVDDERGRRVQATLPAVADLRSGCSAVSNQGRIGACTGFAIADGLAEFMAKKAGKATELSPGFLYYEERQLQANPDMTADTGATIEVGMKVLEAKGVAPEADHPYLASSEQKDPAALKAYLGKAPSEAAYKSALGFKIDGSQNFVGRIQGKLKPLPVAAFSKIRETLAGGMPVVAGIIVFQSMMSDEVKKTGMVPLPDPSKGDKVVGGHAIMLVGYDQAKQVFIVRNSWGSEWGDHGYFYLPYDYARAGLLQDAWTATQ